jgi:hypothetical protein
LFSTALVALAAAPAAFASDAKRPVPWTRSIEVNLWARQLGLPADPPTAPRPGGNRAYRPVARLDGSATGLRFARSLRTPSTRGARPLRQLRFQQTVRGLRVAWSQIDVTPQDRSVMLT